MKIEEKKYWQPDRRDFIIGEDSMGKDTISYLQTLFVSSVDKIIKSMYLQYDFVLYIYSLSPQYIFVHHKYSIWYYEKNIHYVYDRCFSFEQIYILDAVIVISYYLQ